MNGHRSLGWSVSQVAVNSSDWQASRTRAGHRRDCLTRAPLALYTERRANSLKRYKNNIKLNVGHRHNVVVSHTYPKVFVVFTRLESVHAAARVVLAGRREYRFHSVSDTVEKKDHAVKNSKKKRKKYNRSNDRRKSGGKLAAHAAGVISGALKPGFLSRNLSTAYLRGLMRAIFHGKRVWRKKTGNRLRRTNGKKLGRTVLYDKSTSTTTIAYTATTPTRTTRRPRLNTNYYRRACCLVDGRPCRVVPTTTATYGYVVVCVCLCLCECLCVSARPWVHIMYVWCEVMKDGRTHNSTSV